jgi:hypothetical protein
MNASAMPCRAMPAAIAWTMPVSLLLSPLSPDACFAFYLFVFLSLHKRHIHYIRTSVIGERKQPNGSSHEAHSFPFVLFSIVWLLGGACQYCLLFCSFVYDICADAKAGTPRLIINHKHLVKHKKT